jgi:hypothetical protein
MNTSERVVVYLRKHVGEAICDDCFQRELRTRLPLTPVLDLNPDYVARKVDRCGTCGETKLTVCMFAVPTKEELAAKRREVQETWDKLRDGQ